MASRNELNKETEEQQDVDDGILSVLSDFSEKPSKIVLVDADTLIYWALILTDENGNKKEPTEEDLPYLEGKLSELLLGIFNKIEQYFTISYSWVYIKGEGNFRKDLYPAYKSNRPEKHRLVSKLYEYFEKTFNVKRAEGYEAEDFCATIGRKLGSECIIAYCDHDLEEVSDCILYNYQKNKFKILDKATALHNKYKKLVLGEPGDGANFSVGVGLKHWESNYYIGMTEEQYEEQVYKTYEWCWSDKVKVKNKIQRTPNPEKAREMLELAKQIIWLKEVEN